MYDTAEVTDVVFFVKLPITEEIRALPWPRPTEMVYVEPGALGCEGVDRLCSSAFTRVWATSKGPDGRALPGLLARYAPHVTDVGRVAVVGFSAAHGLLSPLASHPADRAAIDAYVLVDACFGSQKVGLLEMGAAAAEGDKLMVASTGTTGGDDCFVREVVEPLEAAGFPVDEVSARAPVAQPARGALRVGDALYVNRYGDELPHWEQHHLVATMLEAYLLPRWRAAPWAEIALYSAVVVGAVVGGRMLARRR